ncbi:hypothetical protein GWK47_041917 [Chionoecetes opilio]|uniref:Ig-like domain-containing protein n=1 Tax=Chionoecetes opilio TaxID=41210 RepID=A0A8J4Y9B6_CHIOP|nr:hypothetical protein GWK47_041917 [Chionoecetes opilio]
MWYPRGPKPRLGKSCPAPGPWGASGEARQDAGWKQGSRRGARTETGVTLSLTSMTSEATGEYKCEVIAEHPSFRTEASGSFMTVLDRKPESAMSGRVASQCFESMSRIGAGERLHPTRQAMRGSRLYSYL